MGLQDVLRHVQTAEEISVSIAVVNPTTGPAVCRHLEGRHHVRQIIVVTYSAITGTGRGGSVGGCFHYNEEGKYSEELSWLHCGGWLLTDVLRDLVRAQSYILQLAAQSGEEAAKIKRDLC